MTRDRLARGLGVLLLAIAGACLVTQPLALHLSSRFCEELDSHLNAWILVWCFEHLGKGLRAVFEGNMFYPLHQTIALSENMLADQLVFAPVYAWTHDPVLSFNILLLAAFVLCTCAMYALAYDLTGDMWASSLAGALYGLSPVRIAQLSHVQLLPAWWTPLGFLFLRRFLRDRRLPDLAIAALALALQFASSIYLGYLLLLGLGLYLLGALWQRQGLAWWKPVAPRIAGAFGLAGVALLPLLWPYLQMNQEFGVQADKAFKVAMSAEPTSYLSSHSFSLLYAGAHGWFLGREAAWEKHLWMGLAPLALAGLAVWALRRTDAGRALRPWLALGIGAVVLSLGPRLVFLGHHTPVPLPYDLLDRVIPGLGAIRVPARLGFLALLAVSALAAIGFAHLRARTFPFRRAVLVAMTAFAALELVNVPLPTYAADRLESLPDVYRFLAHEGSGPVLELPLPKVGDYEGYKVEVRRVYASLVHGRPLVNGYSGYQIAPYAELCELAARGPSQDLAAVLGAIGVATLVLHQDELPEGERERWARGLAAAGLRPVAQTASTGVWRVPARPDFSLAAYPGLQKALGGR